MPQYSRAKRSDWIKSLILIGIYVAVISITAFFLLPNYWTVWLALTVGGVSLLVLWHKKSTAYKCPKCGNQFEISYLTDFISPHGVTKNKVGWTYLKCPRCQNRSKMEVLVKRKAINLIEESGLVLRGCGAVKRVLKVKVVQR